METNDKKVLFTAVSEEECSTVSGGDLVGSLLGIGITPVAYVNQSPDAVLTKDGNVVATNNTVTATFSVAPANLASLVSLPTLNYTPVATSTGGIFNLFRV